MLKDRLKEAGLTKKGLAKILGVSEKTVLRMGDEVTQEVEVVLEMYSGSSEPVTIPLAEKQKEEGDYTREEVLALCRRRGGLEGYKDRVEAGNSRVVEGGELVGLETDYEIAHSIGLRVFEFHRLIRKYF